MELELTDFRCFERLRLEPQPRGVTVLTGPNGTGKTSVLEAAAYLGTLVSFRGSPRAAMVRNGAERSLVRARTSHDGRPRQLEAELAVAGRSRFLLNRRPVTSRRPLAEALPLSVFSPDDLTLLQGPPAARRDLLDGAVSLIDPTSVPALERMERAVRQRNAVLRRAQGGSDPDVGSTLDVWDERLAEAGTDVLEARLDLVGRLEPLVATTYAVLAGAPGAEPSVALRYRASWEGDLHRALSRARPDDLRRGSTTLGPHHDELGVALDGRDARQQASQGEQRCLALALRLAVHGLVADDRRVEPLLFLDDVFSELDPARSRALVDALPPGQTLLTTASPLPQGLAVSAVVDVTSLGASTGTGRDD